MANQRGEKEMFKERGNWPFINSQQFTAAWDTSGYMCVYGRGEAMGMGQ